MKREQHRGEVASALNITNLKSYWNLKQRLNSTATGLGDAREKVAFEWDSKWNSDIQK